MKKKGYQCAYCSYHNKNKMLVTDHEKTCLSNPETMSCVTCLYKPYYEDNTCGCGGDVKDGVITQCDKYICHDDYINKLDEKAFEGHRDKTNDEIIEYIESYDELKTN